MFQHLVSFPCRPWELGSSVTFAGMRPRPAALLRLRSHISLNVFPPARAPVGMTCSLSVLLLWPLALWRQGLYLSHCCVFRDEYQRRRCLIHVAWTDTSSLTVFLVLNSFECFPSKCLMGCHLNITLDGSFSIPEGACPIFALLGPLETYFCYWIKFHLE